jgi:hypothetical protein
MPHLKTFGGTPVVEDWSRKDTLKTLYMLLLHHQIAGPDHNIMMANMLKCGKGKIFRNNSNK